MARRLEEGDNVQRWVFTKGVEVLLQALPTSGAKIP